MMRAGRSAKVYLYMNTGHYMSSTLSIGPISFPRKPISLTRFLIQPLSKAAIYSASLELKATDVCLCDFYETGAPFHLNM
jgi:hypothetical protein